MTSVYVKLIIAGKRTINTIKESHIVPVATRLIIEGTEDGKVYLTFDEVPEKYKGEVEAALLEEGFDTEGNPIE